MPTFDKYLPSPAVTTSSSLELESLVATKLEHDVSVAHQALLDALDADEVSLNLLAAWANAKALFDRLDDRQRRGLLLEPSFRYWLHAIMRFSHGSGERHLLIPIAQDFPGLIWAPAVSSHSNWSARVRLDYRGGLRALPFNRYIEFGKDRASEFVLLELETEHATFRFDDGLVVRIANDDITGCADSFPTMDEHGYLRNDAIRIGRYGLTASTRDPWLRVRLSGSKQRTTGTIFFDRDDDNYMDGFDVSDISEAEGMIDSVWPEEAEDIAIFSRALVPFQSPANTHMAFTVSSRQGAIFIGNAPPVPTTEMIIHEKAHVKLREIQTLDSILVDPLDETIKVAVPWRPDLRPLPGVLEGLYVFVHVAEFAWRYYATHGANWARMRYNSLIRDLNSARQILETRADLTSNGVKFVGAIGNWLDDLSRRDVPRSRNAT